MRESKILTVTELNTLVKAVIENEPFLEGVRIKGEISSLKKYSSGHIYFTLKEGEQAAIACVMYSYQRRNLNFNPTDGMQVILSGKTTLYEARGQYQFIVSGMEADGEGGFLLAFENLKKKLLEKGYFDEKRKKPIPKMPKRVGVITSPTGAAVRDIISIMGRRWPSTEIVVYPSLVQGPEAPKGLIEGLRYFYRKKGEIDVVIIGRGGGSLEDLWAFNDEKLADALFKMNIPVISAVGHETDFSISDFVADLRAPTPSAAAEIVTPNGEDLKRALKDKEKRLQSAFESQMRKKEEDYFKISDHRALKEPMEALNIKKEKAEQLEQRLRDAQKRIFENKEHQVEKMASSMVALNPMAVLSRGYSALFDEENKVVSSAKQLKVGKKVVLHLSDGEAKATVTELKEYEGKEHG